MKLYHCFRDEPKEPASVWLVIMTVTQAAEEDRERLQAYLDQQSEYGFTPDSYYCSDEPLPGYGPFVQEIEVSSEFVFKGKDYGEYIVPSDQINDYKNYFNPNTDWDIENPGLPEWK